MTQYTLVDVFEGLKGGSSYVFKKTSKDLDTPEYVCPSSIIRIFKTFPIFLQKPLNLPINKVSTPLIIFSKRQGTNER
jgi:hypothetical protein